MSGFRRVSGVSRFVDCGTVRLHVLEYGCGGRPLLVLPGITSPAATWEFVAEPLSRDGRVVTWDARGRGRSDHPATGYAVADFAADLKLVLKALNLQRPAILGHSMGARILAYFAARHPDLVGPLIIVDPPMMGPGRPPYASPVSAYLDEIRKARVGALTLEDLRHSWPNWDEQRLCDRQEWLSTCSEDGVRESYHGLEQDDLVESWRALRRPAMLVRGAESSALSAADEMELQAANPELDYVTIPSAGHMVPFDRLDDFLGIVRGFLANSVEERTP